MDEVLGALLGHKPAVLPLYFASFKTKLRSVWCGENPQGVYAQAWCLETDWPEWRGTSCLDEQKGKEPALEVGPSELA